MTGFCSRPQGRKTTTATTTTVVDNGGNFLLQKQIRLKM